MAAQGIAVVELLDAPTASTPPPSRAPLDRWGMAAVRAAIARDRQRTRTHPARGQSALGRIERHQPGAGSGRPTPGRADRCLAGLVRAVPGLPQPSTKVSQLAGSVRLRELERPLGGGSAVSRGLREIHGLPAGVVVGVGTSSSTSSTSSARTGIPSPGTVPIPTPNYHVGAVTLADTGVFLERAHIRSPRVSLEEFIRLPIRDLGVKPRCDDWDERLARTEQVSGTTSTGDVVGCPPRSELAAVRLTYLDPAGTWPHSSDQLWLHAWQVVVTSIVTRNGVDW